MLTGPASAIPETKVEFSITEEQSTEVSLGNVTHLI